MQPQGPRSLRAAQGRPARRRREGAVERWPLPPIWDPRPELAKPKRDGNGPWRSGDGASATCDLWRAPGSPTAGAGGRRGRVAAGGGTGELSPGSDGVMALAPGGRQIAGGLMGRGVRPGRSPETRRAGFSRSQSGKGVCKDARYHNLYQDSRDICSSGDSSPKVFFLNFFVER